MATIAKIESDIIKTKEKIKELQNKVRILEMQKIEQENLQIVQLVKAVDIDNKTLTGLLKAYATGKFKMPEEYQAEAKATNKEGTNNENKINSK